MRVDQIRRLSDSRPARLDRTRRRFGRSLVLTEKTLPLVYSPSGRHDILHFFSPSGRHDVFHFFKQPDRVRGWCHVCQATRSEWSSDSQAAA